MRLLSEVCVDLSTPQCVEAGFLLANELQAAPDMRSALCGPMRRVRLPIRAWRSRSRSRDGCERRGICVVLKTGERLQQRRRFKWLSQQSVSEDACCLLDAGHEDDRDLNKLRNRP